MLASPSAPRASCDASVSMPAINTTKSGGAIAVCKEFWHAAAGWAGLTGTVLFSTMLLPVIRSHLSGRTAHGMLDFARLEAAKVTAEPFAFTIVPGFVAPEFRDAIETDYPRIKRSGSFPLPSLSYGPAFADMIGELTGPAMRAIVARKFAIDLDSRPVMVTVRGQCARRDGHIHTDSTTKLITMLLYTNRSW